MIYVLLLQALVAISIPLQINDSDLPQPLPQIDPVQHGDAFHFELNCNGMHPTYCQHAEYF